MNARFLHTLVAAFLCLPVFAQDMDTELSKLAKALAVPVKEAGHKKVTVLDFTDLQGNTSELGRYIAEQLTVDLVMAKPGFAILDRANLNKILAEHKLTASGLVDPENAKKLGQFAGVDALILGTMTPKMVDIDLTAKIITTDTAEIIGAAKGKLPRNDEVEVLLTNTVPSNPSVGGNSGQLSAAQIKGMQVDKNSQRIGDLLVKVESLKLSPGTPGFGGTPAAIIGTLAFANLNPKEAAGIALLQAGSSTTLVNKRGDRFTKSQSTGLGMGYIDNGQVFGEFTDVPAGGSIKAAIQYFCPMDPLADHPPYRLTMLLLVGKNIDGRYANVKQLTFMIDVDQAN